MKLSFFKELKRRNVYKVATVYAITGWLLIQISDIVFPRLNFPDWTVSFVIVGVAIGFPIALILAWAFEMTAEGIKRTEQVQQVSNKNKGKKLNYWIIGLLIVTLLFLGAERIFFAESTLISENITLSKGPVSLAVLPFSDFSPDGDQEYFADGISEELLNVLAQVESLRVVGRTSSFQFKGENSDLKEVGEKLGVNYILEGSVRKAGDQLRITAQLIKAENGFHEWSETFDRVYTTKNVFEIQDEISAKVLKELKVKLGASPQFAKAKKSITGNKEAYELYLKGLTSIASHLPEDIKKAIEFYSQATKLDSTFAMAYAKKASAYSLLKIYGNLSPEKCKKNMRIALDWATIYNEESAEALMSLADLLDLEDKSDQKYTAISRAIELQPGNGEIRLFLGFFLMKDGKIKKGGQQILKAYELDPLSANINVAMGWYYYQVKWSRESEDFFKQAIKIQPDLLDAYVGLTDVHVFINRRMDRGIITMHKAYDRVQKKSQAVSRLFWPAINLNLDQYAQKWIDYLAKNFPNREGRIWEETVFLTKQKRYDAAIQNISQLEKEGVEPLKDSLYVNLTARPLMLSGRNEDFLQIIKNKQPYLFDTDTLIREHLESYLYLALALKRTGDTQRGDRLLRNIVSHIESNYPGKNYLEWYKNDRNILVYMSTKALLGDKSLIIQHLEQRKKRKFVAHHWHRFDVDNELFYNLPEEIIEPYRRAELEIINEQRQNVIDYLREQDEWNEEWQ